MTSKSDWQTRVGVSWASEWERTDRSFGVLTDQLMSKLSERPIMRALDIGCGAGEMSLALGRGHPGVEIIGVDVSEELVEVARHRGSRLGNVSFEVADAGEWQRDNFAPDLLFSRHGVMFFPDPVASFSHLASIAATDARLVFSCFRALEDNLWAERIESFLPPGSTYPPDRFSPGPFSFADQSHVDGVLRDAGWVDINFIPVDYAYIAGTGPDAVEDAAEFFQRIGPAARASRNLDTNEHAHFLARMRRFLANNVDDGIIALRAGAWIVSARLARG